MKTKIIFKWAALVLLLIFFFCAGFYASAVIQFWKSAGLPRVESETQARNKIRASLPLPENATHLYYAIRGFLDADRYVAFSLSDTEACEQFIKKELNLKLEDFQETTELPDVFAEFGPDTWPLEHQDPLWDLSESKKYLLCTTTHVIVYVPEKFRFYFHF